jgi:hypothetical protein
MTVRLAGRSQIKPVQRELRPIRHHPRVKTGAPCQASLLTL